MLKGLFPRLFGNFREGGIIHAKFVVTTGGTSPVYTLKSNQGSANYPLTLVGASSGNQLTLTVPGGARNIGVLHAGYINIVTPGTPGAFVRIEQRVAIVEATGVVSFAILDGVTAANDVSVTGDEISFTLYVDK